MKARVFFLPLAALMSAVILWVAVDSDAHRLSGHPRTLEGKLRQARRQVWHDRQQLRHRFGIRHWLRLDVAYVRQLERDLSDVRTVICRVFGPYCSQALRVSYCESRLRTWARNGQYLGVFQMGAWERSRYGHGRGVRSQASAAYRYFMASGANWGPWECKP